MRIVKEAQERKQEILNAAQDLFAKKGYEATSTGDILQVVGIARGTLYYHFPTKEAILDEVVIRFTDSLISRAKQVASKKELPLLDRITLTMTALNANDELGLSLMHELHKKENILLHEKVNERLLGNVVAIFTDLIEEGNGSGLFKVAYPKETAEMIMTYSQLAFDQENGTSRLEAFIDNVEKLLCMPKGAMAECISKIFE